MSLSNKIMTQQKQIEPYGLIYKTTNLINNKIYIGQTVHIKDHFSGKYIGGGTYFNKAVEKHKKENFKCEFICYAYSLKELNDLEQFHIKEFNSIKPNGYNLSSGGGQGGKLHEETKKKLSISVSLATKGKPKTPEHNKKVALANLGQKRSDEAKKNMSEAAKKRKKTKGKPVSVEARIKIANTLKGKMIAKDKDGNTFQISNKDPRFLSGELTGVRKGKTGYKIKPCSLEAKQKLREANLGRVPVKDKDGNRFQTSVNDPRYLSGELVSVHKKVF